MCYEPTTSATTVTCEYKTNTLYNLRLKRTEDKPVAALKESLGVKNENCVMFSHPRVVQQKWTDFYYQAPKLIYIPSFQAIS